MDGERFDALAKVVAAPSRRGVLRLLAGAVLGAAVASPDVAAAGCRERLDYCERDSDCCGWEGRRRTICARRGWGRPRCCSRRGGSCTWDAECCGSLECRRGNCRRRF